MNLNRAMIIGNLTRDPEMRTTPNGKNNASFGVATTYNWTDQGGQKQSQTEYHNIIAWGKLADICGQYLSKGKKVYVEGRIQTREWEAQDGTKRNRTEIVADNLIMLDRAGSAGSGAPGASFASSSEPAMAMSPMASSGRAPESTDEIRVEDIPF